MCDFPAAGAPGASGPAFWPVTIAGGATILCPPHVHSLTTYALLEREDWFEPDLAFLRAALHGGRAPADFRLVDVGTNLGIYTLSLMTAAGPGARTLSFEPNDAVLPLLRASLARADLTEQVTVFPEALGATPGRGILDAGSDSEIGRLRDAGRAEASCGGGVPICRLDDRLSEAGWPRVDLLKIDVEGMEAAVLAGAERLISGAARPVILAETGAGSDLLEILERADYALYQVLPGPGAGDPGTAVPWLPQDRVPDNLLAVPANAPPPWLPLATREVLSGTAAPGGLTLEAEIDAAEAGDPVSAEAVALRFRAARRAWRHRLPHLAASLLGPLEETALAGRLAVGEGALTAPHPAFAEAVAQPPDEAGRRVWASAACLDGLLRTSHMSTQYLPLENHRRLRALDGMGALLPEHRRAKALLERAAGVEAPLTAACFPTTRNGWIWDGGLS